MRPGLYRIQKIVILILYFFNEKKWDVSLFFPLTFLLLKYVVRFFYCSFFMDDRP